MEALTLDADEFGQLKRAFMGGFTHANAHFVDKKLYAVASQDFTSSYPAVMVLEKFPMSRAKLIDHPLSQDEFHHLMSTKACLVDLILYGVYHKLQYEHPIPRSKCWLCDNAVEDNGRIVMADRIGITVTEQDFATFSEFYSWDKMEITTFRYYEKQYLPRAFVEAILGLYERKTTLKDVIGEEVNYMISKGMLNSAYGMAVTNPVRDEINYDNDVYTKVKPVIEDAISIYNKNIRRFLFYPWGVWVTAYARRNLFDGIKAIGEDYVYSDTDSIKYLQPERHQDYFENYNRKIEAKISLAAGFHHLEVGQFSPPTKEGIHKTLGFWDYEGCYSIFKTLGAKRYLTQTDGKLKVTLAGANKKDTAEYLRLTGDPFGNFKDGLRIPAEYAGRLTATYIDEEHEGTLVDLNGVPYHYHELSSMHLEPSEYNLEMSDKFLNYLKGVKDLE